MLVYVLNQQGKPLMPCSPQKARILLKKNKANVVKTLPFTIKLIYGSSGYKQPLILGVDTGSGKVGSAVLNSRGVVLYVSEVEIRNDIAKKMSSRSKSRRNRRNRKTRYRKARWLNRKNSIKSGRFSPTMVSKINSHLKEIKFVKSILPIAEMILETTSFDPHALKNPEVLKNKWLYQRGIRYGFANTKAYILNRDNHTCRNCKGKTKDRKLEVHHIIFEKNGGSDEQDNLITLCKPCHDDLHNGKIALKKTGKRKGQLKHATQMNSIRTQLLKLFPDARETFGFITKEHRQLMSLPKEHYTDAVVIASQGQDVDFKTRSVLLKKCVSDGDYQQTKGIRSEQRISTGKMQGFRKFDKVRYLENECFIKGRMSTGYAILMTIEGVKLTLKPIPKFNKMERISARKSWIIHQKTIASF